MLRSIRLRDFALVKECTIPFGDNLNVISGETGAGKTILTKALRLALGEKADASFISNGKESALVEAVFEPANEIYHNLIEMGFSLDPSDPLIIKRELSLSGKNRLFINGESATLNQLQSLGTHLVDLVSQNESQTLRSTTKQRELLDTFAKIDFGTYQSLFSQREQIIREIDGLEAKKELLIPKLPKMQETLDEIIEINTYDGEDTFLFEQHKEFMDMIEQFQGAHELSEKLTHILLLLQTAKAASPTPTIESVLKEAITNVGEASYELETKQALQLDPKEHEKNEERLTAINQLLKKHGGSFSALETTKDHLQEEIDLALSLDQILYEKQQELSQVESTLLAEAETISKQRKSAAQTLETTITTDLQSLNMKGAIFSILIENAPLSPNGSDTITFFLQANKGEKAMPLQNAPSGGEISRLLFTLKLHLSSAETLIFDEIDANIGGETARMVGQKLSTLAKKRQVLCITHFAQVAELADHHLCISKSQDATQTLCTIKKLSNDEKKLELLRMLGGIHLSVS